MIEQGDIRLVLTSGLRGDSEITRFACAHGDGVKDTALTVPDAAEAYRQAVQRGARGVTEPHWAEDDFGRVQLATIATYGENVHTFVNRSDYAGPFLPGFQEVASTNGQPATGVGLKAIDHVVGNVELGRMDYWVEFYERTMGFTNIIHFADEQIHTEYSALMSKVMADGQGKIKFPINEPAEGKRKSQIEEYLEYFGGPGVQHVALQTEDIVRTVETLQEHGVVFLSTPEAYYEDAVSRVGEIGEDWDDLRRLRILADRDEDGLPAPDLHEDGAGPADALLRGDRASRRARFRRGELQGPLRGDRARAGAARQSLERSGAHERHLSPRADRKPGTSRASTPRARKPSKEVISVCVDRHCGRSARRRPGARRGPPRRSGRQRQGQEAGQEQVLLSP